MANECSKEYKDYADFWQNYYTPEDAYAFGLKVQRLVSNEDLSGIFSLVQGELQNGPRKEFVANKTFKEVFDEEWISQVMGDNAPCSPIGWRGFMLGNGLIWYNKVDDGWTIFSINGEALEIPDNPLLGWTINETMVHPFCFNRPWMSGDNFEEFAEVFEVKELGQFFKNPGLFSRTIKGVEFYNDESYCTLESKTNVRGLNALLFDAKCSSEGEEYIQRVMLMKGYEKEVYIIQDGWVGEFLRCD